MFSLSELGVPADPTGRKRFNPEEGEQRAPPGTDRTHKPQPRQAVNSIPQPACFRRHNSLPGSPASASGPMNSSRKEGFLRSLRSSPGPLQSG